jgi:hypothetical protein
MTRTVQFPADRPPADRPPADRPPAGGRKQATQRWRRAGPLVVVLAMVAALAAACDGGSHDAASSSRDAVSVQSSAEQSGIRYASCIRAHGVPDFPDSAVVSGGLLDMHIPESFKVDPQFQSASQACRKDLPGGSAPPKHFNLQAELSFARCMRSHGITWFPDPMSGGEFNVNLASANSPQFTAAAQTCQSTGVHWNSAP